MFDTVYDKYIYDLFIEYGIAYRLFIEFHFFPQCSSVQLTNLSFLYFVFGLM